MGRAGNNPKDGWIDGIKGRRLNVSFVVVSVLISLLHKCTH